MGQKPDRTNANVYMKQRIDLNLTRDQASNQLEWISADRIDRIEHERVVPSPEEIVAMAEVYKAPQLCNYYCSHQCRIGQSYVPEIKFKDISNIVLETLNSLNSIEEKKNRLIEITADSEINSSEIRDFVDIQDNLERMSIMIETLQLWSEQMIAEGKIDKREFEMYKKSNSGNK